MLKDFKRRGVPIDGVGLQMHISTLDFDADTLTVNGTTYKIDFVVEAPNGEMKLAIELDGHDFHEKTKEQAARDRQRERTIVKQGYTIFRFTGSEVFRNPRKCVEEVIEMIASTRK